MKTEREIRERFHELYAKRLHERMIQFLGRDSRNCQYNVRMRVKRVGLVGFCQNPQILAKLSGKSIFVCNDEETACKCRLFFCRNTDVSVKVTFEEILRSPARCGHEYPKLAVLIWFLEEARRQSRGKRLVVCLSIWLRSLWNILSFKWW